MAAPQWQHAGQRLVEPVEAGDLRKHSLRSNDHPSGVDVIDRLVPRTDQPALLVDVATRQVRAKVAAPAADREHFLSVVPDGIGSDARHLSGRQTLDRSYRLFFGHDAAPLPSGRAYRRRCDTQRPSEV